MILKFNNMKIVSLLLLLTSIVIPQEGDAMEYYLKGEYAKLSQNYEDAIFNFIEATLLDSNSAIIFYQLSECYQEINDIKNAILTLKTSLKKSNYSKEIGGKALDFFDSIGDSVYSREILDTLIYYNNDDIDFRYKKVKYSYLDKKYDILLNEYKEIFYINPGNLEVIPKMVEIGNALGIENFLKKLIIEIVDDFPKLTQPLLAQAEIEIGNENFIDAILLIEKAYNITMDESLIISLINISRKISFDELVGKYLLIYERNHKKSILLKYLIIEIAIENNQYYYAQKLIKGLINKNESDFSLFENLVFVSTKINDLEDTYNIIHQKHLVETGNIIYVLLLAEIQSLQNDNSSALNWFLESLKLDKSNSNLRHIVANLSESLLNYELSDSIFTEIINSDKTDASGFNNYAYSLCERSNPNLNYALTLSMQAIKIEPENEAFLDTIGWIYFKMGDFDLALNYILKSSKIDNKSEVILSHLAEVYLKLNQKSDALNVYYKMLNINENNLDIIKKIKQLNDE